MEELGWLHRISTWSLQHIPLYWLVARQRINPAERPGFTRLIEQIIVAVVTGACATLITLEIDGAKTTQAVIDLRKDLQQEHNDTKSNLQLLQQEINDLRIPSRSK